MGSYSRQLFRGSTIRAGFLRLDAEPQGVRRLHELPMENALVEGGHGKFLHYINKYLCVAHLVKTCCKTV